MHFGPNVASHRFFNRHPIKSADQSKPAANDDGFRIKRVHELCHAGTERLASRRNDRLGLRITRFGKSQHLRRRIQQNWERWRRSGQRLPARLRIAQAADR